MIFNKQILGLCLITAKPDSGRPVLECLKIVGNKVVATDGYLLLQTELPQNDYLAESFTATELQNNIDLIRADMLAIQVKKIRKNKRLNITSLEYVIAKPSADNTVDISVQSIGSKSTVNFPKSEGEYPDTDKVLNPAKARENKAYFCVDPKKMIQMMEACIKSGCGNAVKISTGTPNDPVLVEAKDYDQKPIEGLIMPIRSDI